jgi:hypothetical protein
LQWLQDPNQNNADNLNNLRHETGRNFKKKAENILMVKLMKCKQTVRKKYQAWVGA